MLTFSLYEYQTFLKQIDLDTKIKDLLNAIRDAFDFAQDAAPLRDIMPASRQANILVLMLGHVGNRCDFILSYADRIFCMSSFLFHSPLYTFHLQGHDL